MKTSALAIIGMTLFTSLSGSAADIQTVAIQIKVPAKMGTIVRTLSKVSVDFALDSGNLSLNCDTSLGADNTFLFSDALASRIKTVHGSTFGKPIIAQSHSKLSGLHDFYCQSMGVREGFVTDLEKLGETDVSLWLTLLLQKAVLPSKQIMESVTLTGFSVISRSGKPAVEYNFIKVLNEEGTATATLSSVTASP